MEPDTDFERGAEPKVLNVHSGEPEQRRLPTHDVSDTESSHPERPFSRTRAISEPVNKYLVDWDNDEDPENPINWTQKKKWKNLTIVSLITLIT